MLVGELMPMAEVKIYKRAAHGLYLTHSSQLIDDILAFVAKVGKCS